MGLLSYLKRKQDWYSTEEAAEELHTSPEAVRKLIQRGKLPAEPFNKAAKKISRQALEAEMRKRGIDPEAEP